MVSGRELALLPSFAAVVRRGSFTAAARELRLTKSVISDHVRALEAALGVRLLERTTRRLALTQIGEQVMAAALDVMKAADTLAAAVEDNRKKPTGTLRVTAPHDLARSLVAAVFAELATRHAELRFELLSADVTQDLVAAGIDVALRLGVVRQPGLVTRRLSREAEIIVAAPGLAERHAHADRPSQLTGLPWVGHAALDFGVTWQFRSAGAVDGLPVSPRARAGTTDGLRELMLAGVGAAVLPSYAVRADLAAGVAVRLCPAWTKRELTLYAVLPGRSPPPRTRVFLATLPAFLSARGL